MYRAASVLKQQQFSEKVPPEVPALQYAELRSAIGITGSGLDLLARDLDLDRISVAASFKFPRPPPLEHNFESRGTLSRCNQHAPTVDLH